MSVMYKLCLNLLGNAGFWLHCPTLVPRPSIFFKTASVRCYMKAWKCLDSNREWLYLRTRPTFREGSRRYMVNSRPTSTYSYVGLSDDPDNDETLCTKDYSSFLEEKKNRRKAAITNLQDIFHCTEKELNSILKKHPDLLAITSECLCERVKICADAGMKKEVLKHYPWLLVHEARTLSFQLALIQKMGLYDINEGMILLRLPLQRLRDFALLSAREVDVVPGGSRIMYLCKVLKCQPSQMCKAIAEHTFLQRLPFEQIKKNLDLLLDCGVLPEDILKDVWVFRYNPVTVEERLKMAHDADMKRIKPWVVRCPIAVLTNTLRRRTESLNALGPHSSVLEYLSQRLDCSLENVITLSYRYPPLLKVQVPKLKEVLDFIYNEGFSPQQVYQVPRILCHGLETTQQRLNQIRDLGHNPTTLIVLCKSKREYADYLNKLKSQQKHAFPS